MDLSLTGCLVQCGALLDHGAILDLAIEVGGAPLEAKVKVAESYVDGAAPEAAPAIPGRAGVPRPRRRRRRTASGGSWTRRGDAARVRMRPLSEVSTRELRPLLEEESDHWAGELLWDYRDVSSAVASGVERRALTGFVLQDGLRAMAYCYSMIDAGRAIVGSVFAASGFRGQGLEEQLVEAVIQDAQRHPAQRARRVPDPVLHRARGRPAVHPRRVREPRPPLPGAPAGRAGRHGPADLGAAAAAPRGPRRPPPRSSTAATWAASTPR